MKNILTKEQYLGLFVVITIVGIFLTINFLKGIDVFSGTTAYYTKFNNVEGLTAKSPVYIRGLKVGSIDRIKYDTHMNDFIISMNIKSDYAIPIDSKAEMYSSDILGSKSIRINMGTSNIHAKRSDTLNSYVVPDVVSLITSEIGPFKDQLTSVMNNLNNTLNNINNILDSSTQKNLSETFVHLNATANNAHKITAELKELAPSAKQLVANLNDLSQTLKDNRDNINESLNNIKTLSGDLANSKLDEAINNLNDILSKLNSSDGSLGKLMNSGSIYNNVDSLIINIDDLISKIKNNPKKYIKISVF